MKKFVSDFAIRGLVATGFGPIILAIVYMALQRSGVVYTLTVNELCIGIFSTSILAFIVGGMNAIYKIERMPLMLAILIHGVVLYVCYLVTYLVNYWLDFNIISIIVFSAIFVVTYILIWIIIYSVTQRSTNRINEALKKKRRDL